MQIDVAEPGESSESSVVAYDDGRFLDLDYVLRTANDNRPRFEVLHDHWQGSNCPDVLIVQICMRLQFADAKPVGDHGLLRGAGRINQRHAR